MSRSNTFVSDEPFSFYHYAPMLAAKTRMVPSGNEWIHEVKWDGYRIIAHVNQKSVVLFSRNGQNVTLKYKPIVDALSKLNASAVIDGEIVLLNEYGRPDFELLQKYSGNEPIAYYCFDLMMLSKQSLLNQPLSTRKRKLQQLLSSVQSIIKYNEHFDDGKALYEQSVKLGLEGIVSKKLNSSYKPGARTGDWLKLPTAIHQEFVICGWSESDNARNFKTILFGRYKNDGKLYYVGHAGSGMSDKMMKDIFSKLQPLETKRKTIANNHDIKEKVHWVKPELVAEFKYATVTKNNKIRKPAIFLGFRYDKRPKEVTEGLRTSEHSQSEPEEKLVTENDSNWRIIQQQKITARADFKIDDHVVELTNVDRRLWDDITKADLIKYYHSIASFILPHLKDRPLSLHIKHNGPLAPGIYIKDMEGNQPQFVDTFLRKRKHKKQGRRDVIDYAVCNNEAALLYLVNLGCIDLNPWNARTISPDSPDYIVIDLDPSDEDFGKAVETARAAHQLFSKMALQAFYKTSGKTGIHILLPCRDFTFPIARKIAENICDLICDQVSDIATRENTVSKRGSKLYVDASQNDDADTIASAYSVRPYYIPQVSTPIQPTELKSTLKASAFNIHTIENRLEKKGDLFKSLLQKKIAVKNTAILQRFI